MNLIHELEAVALTQDLPEHGLRRGDVGAVVLVHGDGLAYEVEFVGHDGNTRALLTLQAKQVRSLTGQECSRVGTWSDESYVASRAKNASQEAFAEAMAEVPVAPPLPGDEWP